MLALLPLAMVLLGFLLRASPPLVVLLALLSCMPSAGFTPLQLLEKIGAAFSQHRGLLVLVLMLPLIGLIESNGLRERIVEAVQRVRAASVKRVLLAYLALRQLTAAIGLTSIGGHAQTVRPLLVPMLHGLMSTAGSSPASGSKRAHMAAFAAATDNVALFFGEDLFLAFAAVLLMQSTLLQFGYEVDAIKLALYGIPTAITAFLIHAIRISRIQAT
jgi:uncharacterized membrane protein